MRTQPRHDQVGREVEDDVADVEQGQAGGDLVRREMQHRAQVVVDVRVHGLGQADVGPDGGAEEVEHPEGGDYAAVEFAGGVSGNN